MQSTILNTQATTATSTATALATTTTAASHVIVLNDNKTSTQWIATDKISIFETIEKLVVECAEWEENAFRVSNENLYSILQKCYGIYKAMEGNSTEAKSLRDQLANYVSLKGYKFKKSSHTITRIVKCVFGRDAHRVSTYSIALRSALSNNVSILDIVDYIRSKGGVEEIRLSKSLTALSTKQKAEIATKQVSATNMGTFSSKALASSFNDAGKIGTNTVLIGTWQSDGSIIIRAVVESDTVLTAALVSHYSTITQALKVQAAEQEIASASAIMQTAITAAAASASVTVTATATV